MRFTFFFFALALVAGCRVEPRADAPDPLAEPLAETARQPETGREAGGTVPVGGAASTNKPEVVLYVTEWCPYCKQAREFMAAEGVPHRVVDIEASAENQQAYQAMGGTGGIPLVAVGTETIEGWSAGMARQMLDAAGYD